MGLSNFQPPSWAGKPGPGLVNCRFDVVKGGSTIDSMSLYGKESFVFGRHSALSDYALDHPSLSRAHAAIVHGKNGRIFLMDLGSAHGTTVNDKKVSPQAFKELHNGDRVRFAASSRTYVLQGLCEAASGAHREPNARNSAMGSSITRGTRKGGTKSEEEEEDEEEGEEEDEGEQQQAMEELAAQHQLPLSFGKSQKGGMPLTERLQQTARQERRQPEKDSKEDGKGLGRDSGAKSQREEERRRREAEIRAMTEAMMKAPPEFRSNGSEEPGQKNQAAPRRNKNGAHGVVEEEGDEDDSDEEGEREEQEEEQDDGDEGFVSAKALEFLVPLSHELRMRGHKKTVTALAFDPAGSRLASGSLDYRTLFWDFAGMDRAVRPFRDVEVEEGNVIVALSYSPTGDKVLAATGSCQPKVYTRDALPVVQFIRGDVYKVDMAHTQGHTKIVSGGCWHPSESQITLTSSMDGSLRLWDLRGKTSFEKLICKSVAKARSKRGTRVAVTACAFSMDGRAIAGGTQDGQLQVWDIRARFGRPDLTMSSAHDVESSDRGITSVVYSPDGFTLASRGADDIVKLWDIRNAQKATKILEDLPATASTANVAFSPDGTCLAVGVVHRLGCKRGRQTQGPSPVAEDGGEVEPARRDALRFFDVHSAEDAPIFTTAVGTTISSRSSDQAPSPSASSTGSVEGVVCVAWHDRIKQVAVGTASGDVFTLYDPRFSQKGAMLSAGRVMRKKESFGYVGELSVGKIHNPHALPMYREGPTGKRKREKDRLDPIKSRKPEAPLTGPGVGGRIGGNYNFTQYLMRGRHKGTTLREEDPREALLKYAETAGKNPKYFGEKGQVAPRYDLSKSTLEEEQEEMKKQAESLLDT